VTSRVKLDDRVQNLTPPRLVADRRVGGPDHQTNYHFLEKKQQFS